MSSPFKMKYGGASALLKTLVGDQKSLPPQLKKAIEAAPESSPVKKDNKFVDVDVDKAESKEVKIKGGRGKTQTVTKQTVKRVVPRSAGEKTSGEKKSENTKAARQGEGRLGTKTTIQSGSSTRAKTALAGTAKDASGRTKYRTLADGTKAVVEGSVNTIKPRGIEKKKSPAKMKGDKNKEARLRAKKTRLGDKAMNFPGKKQVSQKRSERLLDREEKIGKKIRKIRNKA